MITGGSGGAINAGAFDSGATLARIDVLSCTIANNSGTGGGGIRTASLSAQGTTTTTLRNKGAFMVYGLTWAALVFLFALLVNTVFMLLGAPQLVAVAALPAGLMFSTVFYASLYFTFTDCFEQRTAALAPPDAEPSP